MLRKLLSTVVCTLLFAGAAFAQGTITGTVTDGQSGEALPGVNIQIPDLQKGTASDAEGNYTISNVPAGTHTVVASFIGYKRYEQQVTVTSGEETVLNISLQPDVVGLEDVVVTAQGIQREQRALGYSVSEVSSDALENQGESDVSRILSGKVSGVNVTQSSGVSGTPTDIVIRGYTTLTGSNQPLFIVDGVRFNSSTNTGGEDFTEGGNLTSSSRFLDIDPSNIKSVNVLKGLSATTIYGEQGKNGVILIETKSGSFAEREEAGFDVNIQQSFFQNEIASLPDYQDKYGGGFHQNFGYFFSNWGPAFDSQFLENVSGFQGFDNEGFAQFPHPYSQFSDPALLAAFPEFQGQSFSYKPYDNVENFFQTGNVVKTSFQVSGGTQDANVNLNVSRSDEEGFTPGNNLIKNNVGLGLNFRPFEDLTIKTTANVALTDMETPPIAASFGSSADPGGGGSVFGDVLYTPRSIDLNGLPHTNPVTGGSVYYRSGNDIQNPFWTVNNIKRTDNVDRLYGKTEITYDVLDEISISYKLGLDTYSEDQAYLRNKGGVNNPDLTGGYMHTRDIQQETWDHNLFVNFNTTLTEEISVDGLVGGQLTIDKYQQDGLASTNQIVLGLFEHPNFTSPSATNGLSGSEFQFQSREETAGVFFDATADYDDIIYLNLSGRNDWFSTLETDNRSIFYPSASLSFIPTEAFDFGGDILSYLKIRGGVGTSAGAPSPYNTRSSLGTNARAFLSGGGVVSTNATSNFLGNPNLKPEKHTEYEVGVESKFIESRVRLEVTAYQRKTNDLITNAQLDPSTGFTSTLVNIGEIENRGLEIQLGGTPIQGDFNWNTTWNFYAYESEVTDLGQDLEEVTIAGFTNLGNFAIEGEPLNIMQGSVIERDDQGRRLVNENGDYIQADGIDIIGDPNPDYTLSAINTFRYKNFSLNFQVDYKNGGDVYSTTVSTLLARGISEDTGFDRQRPVILPGVKQNGEPNDIQISATQAFFTNIGFGPAEVAVYDGSVIRLSEVSFSYSLPNSILNTLPLKGAKLTLSGFNLWYFAPNIPEGANFDPNVAGTGVDNGLGFDYLNGPSSRRIGGSISLQF